MRWEGLIAACTVGLLVASVAAADKDTLPKPWFRTGTAMPGDKCKVSVAPVQGRAFDKSLMIRCDRTTSGFASVMQQIAADDYRGKRVRLSAQVRGDAIANWAGLWMRVDGEPGKMLAFDNMQSRSLSGSFDWREASVVLDVAPAAEGLAFGLLQEGDGTTYAGAIALDIVGADVPTTQATAAPRPRAPGNLSLRE